MAWDGLTVPCQDLTPSERIGLRYAYKMAFEIIHEIGGKKIVYPVEKDEIVIGRSVACDLVVNHVSVSRKHARLFRDGDAWRVEDLGSTNGTRVNDLPHTDKHLESGDAIFLQDLRLTFVDKSAPVLPPSPLADKPPTMQTQTMYRSTVDFAGLANQPEAGPSIDTQSSGRLQKLVTVVSGASKAILTSASLDETFNKMLELVLEHLPVQRCFIMLWDEEQKDLVARCSRDNIGSGAEMRFSRTIAEKVFHDQVAVITMDAQIDDRFSAGESIVAMGIRSAMAAPLWNGDKVDGLICADTTLQTKAFDAFDLDLLSALGNHLAVSLEQFRLQQLALEKEKLDRELAVARDIQMGILPQKMPALAGYDVAGLSQPADETGGDTFDFITLPHRKMMVLLGDATGHGIGPALSVTQVRSMLRVLLRVGADLDSAYTHINDQLAQDLADNRFVTALLGLLDAENHTVAYHAGGQGPTMHFHAATGEFDWHGATTMPMGFMETTNLKESAKIELAPGDILGLMTDGVFECENPDEVQFGQEGVEKLILEHRDRPMAHVAEIILKTVDSYKRSAPQADDITIVLLRRLPS